MNYKEISNGKFVMDIVERDTLSKIGDEFDNNQNPSQQDKQDYFDAFVKFFDFFLNYCNNEFKGKTYNDDHIIPQVFVIEVKSDQSFKQYLRYSLYCAKLYVEFLKNFVCQQYLHRYKTLRLNLLCDMEWLLAHYESHNKNVQKEICFTCGKRSSISSRDMMWVLTDLTEIENAPDIKDITLRDIQPYRMFVVRQLLEMLGKNIIGYDSIDDKNGKPIHKFTQIPWEFLDEYSKMKKIWNITLPFNISSIYAISKWSNSFVHSGHIHASYIQYYAITVLDKLMKTPQNRVKCYNGSSRYSNLYGDFRIERYDCLKKDFEQYIKSKYIRDPRKWYDLIGKLNDFFRKGEYNPNIKWKSYDEVGAYIISL